MLSVPFPVMTLLVVLFILAMQLFSGKKSHRNVLVFLVACVALLVVTTLRWEYPSALLRNIQSGLAMLLPPVTWYGFVSMTEIKKPRRRLLLFLPVAVALCLRIVWPCLTDLILALLFTGYGCSLLHIACRGKNPLTGSRVRDVSPTRKALFLAGCFLCISALIDLIIAFDFGINGGREAPAIVVIGHIVLLLALAATVIRAGTTAVMPVPEVREERSQICSDKVAEEIALLYTRIEKQVNETQIYLNPDLTLTLLARKSGLPARQLSGAVNTVMRCNVSQWINGFRIERAKELLRSTSLPVTDIMLESGFTTKSNFNREFQRIAGRSPTSFRQQERDNSVMRSETD